MTGPQDSKHAGVKPATIDPRPRVGQGREAIRRLALIFFLVLFGSLPLWAPLVASSLRPAGEDLGIEFATPEPVAAFQATVRKTVRLEGQVVPRNHVLIQTPEHGVVRGLRASAGDLVTSGDVLFTVAGADRPSVDVSAPIGGRVVMAEILEGEVVGPGEPLMSLESTELSVAARAGAVDAQLLTTRTPTLAAVDVIGGPVDLPCERAALRRDVEGVGRRPGADTAFAYQVHCDLATDVGIFPGMPVELSLTFSSKDGVVAVPRTAVKGAGNRAFVEVVAQDGAPQRRPVTVGLVGDLYIEVIEGLKPGERVLDGIAEAAPVDDQP